MAGGHVRPFQPGEQTPSRPQPVPVFRVETPLQQEWGAKAGFKHQKNTLTSQKRNRLKCKKRSFKLEVTNLAQVSRPEKTAFQVNHPNRVCPLPTCNSRWFPSRAHHTQSQREPLQLQPLEFPTFPNHKQIQYPETYLKQPSKFPNPETARIPKRTQTPTEKPLPTPSPTEKPVPPTHQRSARGALSAPLAGHGGAQPQAPAGAGAPAAPRCGRARGMERMELDGWRRSATFPRAYGFFPRVFWAAWWHVGLRNSILFKTIAIRCPMVVFWAHSPHGTWGEKLSMSSFLEAQTGFRVSNVFARSPSQVPLLSRVPPLKWTTGKKIRYPDSNLSTQGPGKLGLGEREANSTPIWVWLKISEVGYAGFKSLPPLGFSACHFLPCFEPRPVS